MENRKRRSHMAIAVARDVIDHVVQGKKFTLKKIAMDHGYARLSAENGKVTGTKSYKETMQTFVWRLAKERQRALAAMEKKDLSKEEYKVLVDAMTKMTHDVQLLSGESTENIGAEKDRHIIETILHRARANGELVDKKEPVLIEEKKNDAE